MRYIKEYRTDYGLHAHDAGYYQVEDLSQKATCTAGVILFKGTRRQCENWIKARLKEAA